MSARDDIAWGQLDGLHPDLAQMVPNVPDYRPRSVHAARALMAAAMGGSLPEPSQTMFAESGGGKVEIRMHRPAGHSLGGAVFFIHGGGFVMASRVWLVSINGPHPEQ